MWDGGGGFDGVMLKSSRNTFFTVTMMQHVSACHMADQA